VVKAITYEPIETSGLEDFTVMHHTSQRWPKANLRPQWKRRFFSVFTLTAMALAEPLCSEEVQRVPLLDESGRELIPGGFQVACGTGLKLACRPRDTSLHLLRAENGADHKQARLIHWDKERQRLIAKRWTGNAKSFTLSI